MELSEEQQRKLEAAFETARTSSRQQNQVRCCERQCSRRNSPATAQQEVKNIFGLSSSSDPGSKWEAALQHAQADEGAGNRRMPTLEELGYSQVEEPGQQPMLQPGGRIKVAKTAARAADISSDEGSDDDCGLSANVQLHNAIQVCRRRREIGTLFTFCQTGGKCGCSSQCS
jgi:hypothetical protein